jgi:hypothetical protein
VASPPLRKGGVNRLYGIDEAGGTAFTEILGEMDLEALRALARERLRDWSTVEIWQGPVCVVRLRRPAEA